MLSRGERFDRYVIEEPLGEGGMARVYRAHDPRLNRHVALKVLRVDSSMDENAGDQAAARLLREARAAAALDHPNAVSIFDVGEADGELFIAMELVVGKSLRAYVGDDSAPWDTKLRWMVDAARALGAAHERGLVHRDVKPENVMVRADGVVKVLDFGIAKRVVVDVKATSGADDATTQSMTGTIVGTPSYLSPEQLQGGVVDGRTDQFAWAVATYELLTGKLPWPRGGDGFHLVLAILNRTPQEPSKIVAGLPAIVDATIMKALAKTPSQRFEAMEFVVSALEGVVAQSRRSWAQTPIATTKTDPAPPPEAKSAHTPAAHTTRSTLDPARAQHTRVRRVAAATLAVTAVVAAVLASIRATRVQPAPAASAVAPRAAPTALTDLPDPPTSVPEARAQFRAYLQSFRDADWNAAMHALEHTVESDPAHAPAHLRLAFMHSLVSADEALVRTNFRSAVQHRASMSEREQALLDALEPYLQVDPSDPKECERRLEALHERWPLDAEIAYDLGSVRYDRGDLAKAVEAFDLAIAIDPAFAQAWSTRGGCEAYLGRFDAARESLAKALATSRSATEALWYRSQIDEQEGRCADEESDVRAWLARDPEDFYAYQWLARALYAQGKPLDGVRTALEQKWVRMQPDRRAKAEAIDRVAVDLVAGDFASAQERLEQFEKSIAAEPGALAHAQPHVLLMEIAEETGKPERARAVAEAFLARRDAWVAPHRVDDRAIWEDPVPPMLGVLARTGALSREALDARREEWLRTWRAKTSDAYASYLWIYGWALPATSRADADAALTALPQFSPLPPFTPMSIAPAHVGHVMMLAGRADEAATSLGKAVASCVALADPIAHTRAAMWLGESLEAKGDRDRACAAYRIVLDRWGRAKPRSVTAERARARAAAVCAHG